MNAVNVTKRFTVTLEGTGGELAREECSITDEADFIDEAVNNKISEIVEGWILGIGDTIRIVEVA